MVAAMAVAVVSSLQADPPKFPAGLKDLFLLQNIQTEYGAQPASYSTDNGELSTAIKCPERKAVHVSTYVK
jgi:hypothetical protein